MIPAIIKFQEMQKADADLQDAVMAAMPEMDKNGKGLTKHMKYFLRIRNDLAYHSTAYKLFS